MRRIVNMDGMGMIQIPSEILSEMGIHPMDEIEFIVTENGELGIRKISPHKERVAEQLQALYGDL
ncbi:AbrB/MazE/SpoVT family DNA-binding domain-containing protein [Aneurinibacillus sp. Ricciae_BoGa-3]|uniref:AbrB/MazE/SpoVT family DNA-binding domain-containing protein n=1 Tax=Aneurinibacillus sp. Ricciae_BoGa-3 TaxID=3022697 RepID=UPI0023414388|nr:AbrB/MazE/SpoVT family DNA-binding domain-containing protein [Aneurinibacillus sp. Ricciae_BoGa-3]WCK54207.1 AbrB/MazE/SpoVT family DNA-binding domain-containing protein [Aneurinibacillus sp. Ricciae_BoGa-3]